MRIQYFSDLHLEFGELDKPDADADIIIAAGDIGIATQGLQWLKSLGKPVIYVAGNHEFYGQEYATTVNALRRDAEHSQVRYLECESHVVGETRFLGCSLWTELGGEENLRLDELQKQVNDFRQIRFRNQALTFAEYSQLHRISRRWLVSQLEQPFDGKTIIVTHHAPTLWSWHDSPTHIKRFAYCNDLKELFHTYDIAAWFHGHTHAVSDYRCAGARVLCNPRGYYPDQLVHDFDPARTLEL